MTSADIAGNFFDQNSLNSSYSDDTVELLSAMLALLVCENYK